MKRSSDRILTSQAGSLPRPDELITANASREAGTVDEEGFQKELAQSVVDVVRRQVVAGIAVPGDGEYGKSMGSKVNYRAWWSYSFQRLGNLQVRGLSLYQFPVRRSNPGNTVLSSFGDRRDRLKFAAAYADPESGITTGPRATDWPVCVGPLNYTGHAAIAADITNFKTALAASGANEGFMTSIGPASCARIGNEHYKSDDEFVFACAEAMREEYKAIVDAGLILQIDDPAIAENFDQINPEPTAEEYRKFTMPKVEALNHALRGLPKDRVRFHLCWGSWHGPHTTDIAMRDIVDVMLKIDAGAYSFEAGNVRHEHEWSVWQDTKLPDDRLILPGVVSHATNVVEHPELVAERIGRFARLVGRERVIASTDCGLGGRVHRDIAWAKLETLAQGAALASKQLW
ncbi:MAG: cobalamin-independent methionine synthase II family protein [Reyranella sp.]|uniref:cobalamin-independent methionine synthase II family protein n=1 Tax=Reyranella sp. TaxID=1929291 RepID=UPI00272FEB3D|nr:cobalamin-independent methionine synthase II family protein [Reyranella sp.]MDP1964918.1 cobalamin-independent methionine synthase II family protein [Reyranella sp.]MDP2377221.1 cobalamin-independent methionine synthase II family protein [Reyranella sp.]